MKRIFYLIVVLAWAGLGSVPISYAQPAAVIYKMPKTLLKRLKAETEQRYRGECEQKRSLDSDDFYALADGKLLFFIGLPDYFCNASSFMPITVDNQGHWESGAVIESHPFLLMTDAARRLWLVSHWENEAVFPLLHYSIDGVHWQEINLPQARKIDCCFEYIKQICLLEPEIQVKFTGIDDTQAEYWAATVSDILKTTPNWQKLTPQQLKNDNQCQTTPLEQADWQRKTTDTEIRFQSAEQQVSVIIPRWL